MPNDNMITVRFAFKDAPRRKNHPPEWEFYNGTWLAYFAGQPIMWWPEDVQFGLPMDLLEGWEAEHTAARPGRDATVTLRLTRFALAKERGVRFEIVGD